ncbi:MAG: YqeG family HAD IIIA-type phosphatase [Fimbriimonadaceae bacterium]|nr:YqeG family HAD IIIA-type phosphatase [Fimbriimonadaceae bacterium]
MRIPGAYSKDKIPYFLRHFAPHANIHRLHEVNVDELWARGKRLILLDVDNTLLPWRSMDLPQETLDWVKHAEEKGFALCVISNTRHPERLKALCESLGIDFVLARMKPSRQMFVKAMSRHKAGPTETVMIGDQLLTDVLGANRAGIDAIWVTPMSNVEFAGTRINRVIEAVIGRFLFRYFQPSVPYGVPADKPGLFKHQVVTEFLKFAVIGVTSTIIDIGIHFYLMYIAPYGETSLREHVGQSVLGIFNPGSPMTEKAITDAAYAPLKILPVLLAIFNGYFWNSRWTFRVAERKIQFNLVAKFYVVALTAMLVNLGVSTTVMHMVHIGEKRDFAIASFCGLVVAALVNFIGQRQWTFHGVQKRS